MNMYDSNITSHAHNVAAQQNRRGIRVSPDAATQSVLTQSSFQLRLREREPEKQAALLSRPHDDKAVDQLSSFCPDDRNSSNGGAAGLAQTQPTSSPPVEPVKQAGDLAEVTAALFHALRSRISDGRDKSPNKVKTLLSSIPASCLDTLRADNGQTALEIAVDLVDVLAIRLLVEHGVNPAKGRPDFPLAIHVAAERGDMELTQLLIKRGVDLDVSPDGEMTPLMLAAWRGHLAIVKFLVESGARLDVGSANGRNVLMAAVESGDWEVIKFLLAANKSAAHAFDINQQDGIGHTCLSLAYAKHANRRLNALEEEKDWQDTIFLLQNAGASDDFLLSRHTSVYRFPHSKSCIERAVRAGLGKEGDWDAKIAFPDAVEAFYHPNDTSYRSLLKNIPVRTRYEDKQDAIRAGVYDDQ
jgi:hypothetical protein